MNDEKWVLAILKRTLYEKIKGGDKFVSASDILTMIAAIEADAVLGDKDSMAEEEQKAELPWA